MLSNNLTTSDGCNFATAKNTDKGTYLFIYN